MTNTLIDDRTAQLLGNYDIATPWGTVMYDPQPGLPEFLAIPYKSGIGNKRFHDHMNALKFVSTKGFRRP